MSETLTIRNGNLEDLPTIVQIEKKSFDDPFTLDLFVTLLESFPEGFRVCLVRDRAVGYCITYPMKRHRAMVIASIAVLPEFRQKGIGKRLLEDSISISQKYHSAGIVDKLILQVAEDNSAARSLYSKFGFENRSLIRNYYGRRKHGIEMELNLER
jgi:ribosomal-protein-alanine N-acetyltransferase